MSSPNLKREHEKFVCDELLKTLNVSAEFMRMGNDRGEPDVIYKLHNNTVGIEVGTAD